LWTGLGFAVATLTKGVAYLYAFPFLAWLFIVSLKTRSLQFWKPVFLVVGIALLVNAGFYIRNGELLGSFITHPAKVLFVDSIITARLFISNTIRNAGIHLGTPLWPVNYILFKIAEGIHALVGVSLNDPRSTFYPGGWQHLFPGDIHEDISGNLLHFAAIIGASMLFIRQKQKDRHVAFYAGALGIAFFLFCAVMKWHPWVSRYHLPLFILFSPFVSIQLDRAGDTPLLKKRYMLLLSGAIVVGMVLVWGIYHFFGASLLREIYTGKIGGFFSAVFTGDTRRPIEYHLRILEQSLWQFLGIFFLVLVISLLFYHRRWKVSYAVSCILMLTSIPYSCLNVSRKLVGTDTIFTVPRTTQYFINRPFLQKPYEEVVRIATTIMTLIAMQQCRDIGLITKEDGWTYPLAVLLHKRYGSAFRMEHVNVFNVSARMQALPYFRDFVPCAVIAVHGSEWEEVRVSGIRYKKYWSSHPVQLFMRHVPPATD